VIKAPTTHCSGEYLSCAASFFIALNRCIELINACFVRAVLLVLGSVLTMYAQLVESVPDEQLYPHNPLSFVIVPCS
jgi:hypothetical protein